MESQASFKKAAFHVLPNLARRQAREGWGRWLLIRRKKLIAWKGTACPAALPAEPGTRCTPTMTHPIFPMSTLGGWSSAPPFRGANWGSETCGDIQDTQLAMGRPQILPPRSGTEGHQHKPPAREKRAGHPVGRDTWSLALTFSSYLLWLGFWTWPLCQVSNT